MSRLERWTVAVMVALALAGVLVVSLQPSLARRSADFTIDYSAALLIREGHPAAIYRRDQLGPLMLKLSGNAIDAQLPFDAPLATALPYLPLTLLDLEAAFHLWQLITLALLALALVLLARWVPLGRRAPAIGALALLAFPATWALLSEGQSSALLLLGAVLLVRAWQRGSWQLAAAGGCLVALKPQFLPVYLLLFIVRRQWRPLSAAMLAASAIALSPLLAGGIGGLEAMVQSAIDAGQSSLHDSESLAGAAASLLPGRWPTLVAFGLWALALGALLHPAVRRRTSMDPVAVAALASSVAVLFSPHALPHDCVLLFVPGWLAFDLFRRGQLPSPVPAGLAVAGGMLIALGAPLVNPLPWLLLVSLLAYGYSWLRRQARQAQPPASARVA